MPATDKCSEGQNGGVECGDPYVLTKENIHDVLVFWKITHQR